MDPVLIGGIGLIILLLLLFGRMWVGFSMIVVSIIGCAVIGGWSGISNLAGLVPFVQTSSFTMCALPMFVMMGIVIAQSGSGEDLYIAVRNWIGSLKGGLAIATVIACGAFAAVCGESSATAVTMGKIAYPEMIRNNYEPKLASACICAGGTVGIMIPPSVCFIIYGLTTDTSIGKLFIAGIIPGVMQVLFYVITISILIKLKPNYIPDPVHYPMKEKVRSIVPVWPIVAVFLFIVISMYTGICTPTEAGAIGSIVAFLVAFLARKIKSAKEFKEIITESVSTSVLVFGILIGAYFLTRFMALSGLPTSLGNWIIDKQAETGVSPVITIVIMLLFYLISGAFMDSMAALLLTLPIFFPIIISLGYDPIWWGVIMVRQIEISMITPPFGLNLFVLMKSINIEAGPLYRGIWPFVIADVVQLVILVAFPSISLWLPGKM
jgi:tripartite ATP-independent transporter DctM subunit